MDAPVILSMQDERAKGIRDGDVLAFHRRGLWSALIRKWTESPISHVGFAFNLRGRVWVVEAQEGRGVQVVPLRTYVNDTSVQVFWYELHAEQYGLDRRLIIDRALSHCGCRYSSPLQFLRSFVTEEICDWLKIPANLDSSRFFCSDLLLNTLRDEGYHDNPELIAIKTPPGRIVDGLDCLTRKFQVA